MGCPPVDDVRLADAGIESLQTRLRFGHHALGDHTVGHERKVERLTIEVDFGKNYDFGDHCVFAEARLIKQGS